jgi:hypothetical protein
MSDHETAGRFTIRYDVPRQLRDQGFVAYIHDVRHPSDPAQGRPVSWHTSWDDAQRTAAMLNFAFERPAQLPETLRRLERHCRNEAANCDRLVGLVYEHLHPLLHQAAAAWRNAAAELSGCADRIACAPTAVPPEQPDTAPAAEEDS